MQHQVQQPPPSKVVPAGPIRTRHLREQPYLTTLPVVRIEGQTGGQWGRWAVGEWPTS
jgi:hypothetical protein